MTSLLDDLHRIFWRWRKLELGQIPKRLNLELLEGEIVHESFELCGLGTNPSVSCIWDAVKLKNCDMVLIGLLDSFHKIRQLPLRLGITAEGRSRG